MPCEKCSRIEQMLLAVGAGEWVRGSCTCFRCSPHWSDSSSPQASSLRRYGRDAQGRWKPLARIPGKARPTEQAGEVPDGEFEHRGDPIEWS